MKNKKGFTLVELLVTIVVLGIVTGISIPLIRNIRNSNEDKQYITYMDSVKYSAKLYVDSYSEDLFGHEESGCAIIQYTDLEDKSLVNDISLSDISCATEDTYIRVVKLGEKYGYSVSLGCGNKDSEGKVESITIKYPEEVISKDSCGIDAKTIMDFQTTPEKSEAIKYKRRNITLTISSATGVHTGAEIQYGFSKDKGTTVEGGWTSLPISITGEKKQKERIEAGETISIDSDKLTTPAGLTGDYYLVLRIDKLQDVLGRAWTTDKDQSKYIYKGPFRVDNTPPTITNLKAESTSSGYHNTKAKVSFTGSDNYSSGNNLKMCISESSNDCEASDYVAYVSSEDYTVNGDYGSGTHTIYVHLKDAAGNHSSQSVTYTVASKITYDGNGNTGGSMAATYCNNNVDCTLRGNGFTKTGYGFDGWYTAKTGGTKYGATKKLTGNITVYAHWKIANYTITYNLNGGTVSGNPTSYNITSNDITLKNPTKTGYTFAGWTGSNGTTKQKSTKIAKGSTGNKTYTANWTLDSYTITYNLNGGSATGNPTSYSITSNDITLKNPTKDGYLFTGWTGSNGTTKQVSVTLKKGSIGNKTYTANWQVKTVKVTFDCNGGIGGGEETFTYGVNNQKFHKVCTREGYEWKGWKLEKTETTTDYSKDNAVTDSWINSFSPSTTVYAHWEEIPCSKDNRGNGCIGSYWYVCRASNSTATAGVTFVWHQPDETQIAGSLNIRGRVKVLEAYDKTFKVEILEDSKINAAAYGGTPIGVGSVVYIGKNCLSMSLDDLPCDPNYCPSR